MAKEEKVQQAEAETPVVEEEETEVVESSTPEASELDQVKAKLDAEHDNYLRLAAEYDNYRRRTAKEREGTYTEAKSDAVSSFLPVYDNLERALAQQTEDAAYKKGVEMTMQGLVEILGKLGVTIFGEAGEAFDPTRHNAVMHCDDESLGENVICEVFQKGFAIGDRIVRFAMVKVAN